MNNSLLPLRQPHIPLPPRQTLSAPRHLCKAALSCPQGRHGARSQSLSKPSPEGQVSLLQPRGAGTPELTVSNGQKRLFPPASRKGCSSCAASSSCPFPFLPNLSQGLAVCREKKSCSEPSGAISSGELGWVMGRIQQHTHSLCLPHLLQAGGSSRCRALAAAVPSWMPSTGFALGLPAALSLLPSACTAHEPRLSQGSLAITF